MYFLIAGAALFFAVHFYSAFRSRVPGRDIRARMGSARFMALYSTIALIGFALMVWGYGLARPSPQIVPVFSWGRHLNMTLMLPAFILLAAAYLPYGHIKKTVKHPMLLATIFWSLGHLMSNGELNSVILFGSFLAFAIIDRVAVIGRAEPVKKATPTGDTLAVMIGLGLYVATFVYLHPKVIGVPVIL